MGKDNIVEYDAEAICFQETEFAKLPYYVRLAIGAIYRTFKKNPIEKVQLFLRGYASLNNKLYQTEQRVNALNEILEAGEENRKDLAEKFDKLTQITDKYTNESIVFSNKLISYANLMEKMSKIPEDANKNKIKMQLYEIWAEELAALKKAKQTFRSMSTLSSEGVETFNNIKDKYTQFKEKDNNIKPKDKLKRKIN